MTARDRGSVSVETAILAPAFLALVALAGVAGRTAVAHEAIEVAAHDAARAASISRTAPDGRDAARAAMQERLAAEGLTCSEEPTLVLAGSMNGEDADFEAVYTSGLGTDASVVVTVTCDVPVRDLRMPLLSGMRTFTTVEATFASPLDRYRGRSPR
ncbi:pilus assembly protein [Plantactinospora sp. S1510]|uniref:Pilus assembly protein n=1 Tax=Plantactinospora alkalitolerans TaxID=2789879 RepID=A0ABS0GR27_9ACTN|nr:TadE/TadG family type IV pilus assembly protein [Plantactinospora alkalitolerans]MBF9128469.1 pilus assembly protein [Plantactinospora alkalitolerans]